MNGKQKRQQSLRKPKRKNSRCSTSQTRRACEQRQPKGRRLNEDGRVNQRFPLKGRRRSPAYQPEEAAALFPNLPEPSEGSACCSLPQRTRGGHAASSSSRWVPWEKRTSMQKTVLKKHTVVIHFEPQFGSATTHRSPFERIEILIRGDLQMGNVRLGTLKGFKKV
jgi:hypothetical protein